MESNTFGPRVSIIEPVTKFHGEPRCVRPPLRLLSSCNRPSLPLPPFQPPGIWYNNWLNSGSGDPYRTVASNQPNFGVPFGSPQRNLGQHWNYSVIVMDRNVARSLFSLHPSQTDQFLPYASFLPYSTLSSPPRRLGHYRGPIRFRLLEVLTNLPGPNFVIIPMLDYLSL